MWGQNNPTSHEYNAMNTGMIWVLGLFVLSVAKAVFMIARPRRATMRSRTHEAKCRPHPREHPAHHKERGALRADEKLEENSYVHEDRVARLLSR